MGQDVWTDGQDSQEKLAGHKYLESHIPDLPFQSKYSTGVEPSQKNNPVNAIVSQISTGFERDRRRQSFVNEEKYVDATGERRHDSGSGGFMDDPYMDNIFSSKSAEHLPVEEMIRRISNDVDWSRPLHL